jgi:hypothetical protein
MNEEDDFEHELDDEGDEIEQPAVDAGNPVAVRRRKKQLKFDKQDSVNFWKLVFSTPVGRREMFGMLRATHWSEIKFACGPNGFPQPDATWFAAGEQSVGDRFFISWLIMDPENVLLMLRENDHRFAEVKDK